jgi:hypothetical protein
MSDARIYRRRRAVAFGVLVVPVLVLVALLASGGDAPQEGADATAVSTPKARPQLPRGGRSIFPDFRVVAYYGAPQAAALGELGIGTPASMAKRLAKQARPYRAGGRPELPAMELIAVIANAHPGRDGQYRTQQPDEIVQRYLTAARKAKALLILDVQPGYADFLAEARHLEKWLREPDVSLALDPEWKVPPGQVPGRVLGSVDAREVNAVSFWLAGLVKQHDLPEKLLVVHRFTKDMIRDEARLKTRPGIALTMNVDGFGTNVVKEAKYRSFAYPARAAIHNGYKLFYHEDPVTAKPGRVLRLRPRPELVVYE